MKKTKKKFTRKIEHLLKVNEKLNRIQDIDSLLDKILLEARKFTKAEAGSLFLVDNNKLQFHYVQNDKLFSNDYINKKYLYVNASLNIDHSSIAGYVASTAKSLIIDDVYKLAKDVPYTFNKSFDKKSSYKTKAVMTIPLKAGEKKVVGVLQLINPIEGEKVIPFTEEDEIFVRLFSNNAAVAIERAKLTRQMILRMVKMSELRDPGETGAHVKRVAAYAVELYEYLAQKHKIDAEKIKENQDNLRIAAMLHDVGKIAISDLILKKPGKLNNKEFNVMKMHTILGARLFSDSTAENLSTMSYDVALNHHERWDGKGYPGNIKDIHSDEVKIRKGKKGKNIPLWGRIVALADVYDALGSARVYKGPWPEEQILKHIQEQSGKHFDPEVVEAFFKIYEVIQAIKEKFSA